GVCMARVVIMALTAGGGHKSAMYSIARALHEYAPALEVECFESRVNTIDEVHRISYSSFETLYDALYKASDIEVVQDVSSAVFAKTIIKNFMDEYRPYIANKDIQVIISTHFAQTHAMLRLRAEMNAPTKIVAYIPDFDDSSVHFADYKGVRPDAAIAQSPRFLAKLHRRFGVPRYALQQAGFITKPEFSAVRSLTKQEALRQVMNLPFDGVANLYPEKRTFVAAGGSFWVSEIYRDIRELCLNGAFCWDNVQILVVCGQNSEAYQAYRALHEELTLRNSAVRIVPLPFMSAEQLALVYRASNAVMLSGIAPATLYELIETQAGQPVIRRINPGPERYNLKYIVERKLAIPALTQEEFLAHMSTFSRLSHILDESNYAFSQAAEHERTLARRRAQNMALFIEYLATTHTLPQHHRKQRYGFGSAFIRNLAKSGVASEYFAALWSRSASRMRHLPSKQ
ncbi:MAG: hypothetical protein RML40_12170, partial [Bacteroidota bacterium]|nr:hypothetical protein [Candidatus Kapabacteria bacterium]MDW8221271.1 hypothetical protein [Bacteroidota bacterium]